MAENNILYYQNRLKQEYQQVKYQWEKLKYFIMKAEMKKEWPEFSDDDELNISHNQLELLNDQLYIMEKYVEILEKRCIFEHIDIEL